MLQLFLSHQPDFCLTGVCQKEQNGAEPGTFPVLFQCGGIDSSVLLMQGLSRFHKTHGNFFMSEYFLFNLNMFEIRQCIGKFFRKTDRRNTQGIILSRNKTKQKN